MPWVVLTSLGVSGRPCVSPFNAPLLIQYVLNHLSKTLNLPSGEGVSTCNRYYPNSSIEVQRIWFCAENQQNDSPLNLRAVRKLPCSCSLLNYALTVISSWRPHSVVTDRCGIFFVIIIVHSLRPFHIFVRFLRPKGCTEKRVSMCCCQ